MSRPQTRYAIEAYFLLPASYAAAANAKFEAAGFGPDTFTVGLSTTGSGEPAAYHARVALRLSDLPRVLWLANNAPKAWVWLRVRTERLRSGQARALARLREWFDLAPYQDPAWQTRDKAFVKIGTQPIRPDAALAWIAANADPAVTLQVISPE